MSPDELHKRYVNRMLATGIPEATAQEIVVALREVADQRSALRLEAAEGGWLDSDEYVDALQAITDGQQFIRSRFGDDIFERYLYASLEPNRVMVSSAHDSCATGELHPGDLIFRVDGDRCFSIRDFQLHVARRDLGGNDPVQLVVLRGSRVVTLTLSCTQLRQLAVEPAYARP